MHLQKMPNWKVPGPDNLHGFGWKRFTSVHQMIDHLHECFKTWNNPDSMIESHIILIQKNVIQRSAAGSFKAKACLNLLWKLQTGIIADNVYNH